jgi:hypothetical protein
MHAQFRLEEANAHQQQLRDEAAAYRLARAGQNTFRPNNPATRIPRTFGALRRLVGSMA